MGDTYQPFSRESGRGNKDEAYEVGKPLYGNPCSPRALHKTFDSHFRSEGFDNVDSEESVWMWPRGGKYIQRTSMCLPMSMIV